MAKKQPDESTSQPDAVRQVTEEVTRLDSEAGGTPQGASAGLGGNLARFLPALVSPLLEIAGMGTDARIDPDEARRIAQIIYETIQKLRQGG